jgi:hypothetical protein
MEGITISGPEREFLTAIRQGNKDGEQEESVVKAVKELRKSKGRSLRSGEWSEEGGLVLYRGKIYVPTDPDLRRKIVEEHHDSRIAGHAGRWKTLELVSRNFWWPGMSRYIGQYTKACDLCMRTKFQRHLPIGELHPNSTPVDQWETTSVDFIVDLPESQGYDSVMVVIDLLTKRGHFLPTHKTIDSVGAARIFFKDVWKHHGLPQHILSDRGSQFTSQFTRELYRLLGIRSFYSTAYHPQSDGQTERVNQELETYLRIFVNQRQSDWVDLLPLAEFQYNNHIHASTQHTPFMLDSGRNPRMGFEPNLKSNKVESANEFRDRMSATLEEAKAALTKAKDEMAKYYNRRRIPAPVFEKGDRVFLDASDIRTDRPSKKLSHLRLGPFKILDRVSSIAYKLDLPKSMSKLHPVFNVVKLTPVGQDPIPGRHPEPPPDPVIVDGELEYEVEEVLNSRWRHGKVEYLIKWRGFGIEHNSWEPDSNVFAPSSLSKFHLSNPDAVKPPTRNTAIRSLRLPKLRMLRPGLYIRGQCVGASHLEEGVM